MPAAMPAARYISSTPTRRTTTATETEARETDTTNGLGFEHSEGTYPGSEDLLDIIWDLGVDKDETSTRRKTAGISASAKLNDQHGDLE